MRTHSGLHVLSAIVLRDFGAPDRREHGTAHRADGLRPIRCARRLQAARRGCLQRSGAPRPADRCPGATAGAALAIPNIIRTASDLLPPDIEMVRIVDIDGIDMQADGGTHVASTAMIGRIAVTKMERRARLPPPADPDRGRRVAPTLTPCRVAEAARQGQLANCRWRRSSGTSAADILAPAYSLTRPLVVTSGLTTPSTLSTLLGGLTACSMQRCQLRAAHQLSGRHRHRSHRGEWMDVQMQLSQQCMRSRVAFIYHSFMIKFRVYCVENEWVGACNECTQVILSQR